jgi:valyl-tRNA synthetase
MENIRDWCISRQLWWGHRIPAWYCDACGHISVAREDPSACQACGSSKLRQDEDVLDTWFSSGLWPLTTLGWPADDNELPEFYPTSLMETGWDILFFWVARMMMFGIHFAGDVPFRNVYLHSMVLGEDGQKMSKTKGNVIDPVEMIDQYGADALRFYLCTMAGQDAGIVFSRARIEGYRNFCNKLWNAARFADMKLAGVDRDRWNAEVFPPGQAPRLEGLAIADRWILARAERLAVEFHAHLDGWRLDLAAHAAYQFVWHELCDWYLELAKARLSDGADPAERHATQGTLAAVFDMVLRVLHPMIPFITEALWQRLPRLAGEQAGLMIAPWPLVEGRVWGVLADPTVVQAEQDIERLIAIVGAHRMLKAESKVSPAKPVDVLVRTDDPALREALLRIRESAEFVGRMRSLRVLEIGEALVRESASAVAGAVEVALPLAGLVDFAEERKRLAKEIDKKTKELAALGKKLDNPGFVERAPADVVAKERARQTELGEELRKQQALLERLG